MPLRHLLQKVEKYLARVDVVSLVFSYAPKFKIHLARY